MIQQGRENSYYGGRTRLQFFVETNMTSQKARRQDTPVLTEGYEEVPLWPPDSLSLPRLREHRHAYWDGKHRTVQAPGKRSRGQECRLRRHSGGSNCLSCARLTRLLHISMPQVLGLGYSTL